MKNKNGQILQIVNIRINSFSDWESNYKTSKKTPDRQQNDLGLSLKKLFTP